MSPVATTIRNVLANTSVTFAGIKYTTKVQTAAANKHLTVTKSSSANVQLFSNIGEFTNVYQNAVNKALDKTGQTTTFEVQDNYFEHTDCYSLVRHKTSGKEYLYAIFNNASASEYAINGTPATKQQVAQLLTPSAAKQLLTPTNPTHGVIVRTIALDNITQLTCKGQTITF